MANFYALLIGIDDYRYQNGDRFGNLGGCVGDIELVTEYLKKLKAPPQITRLIAPIPSPGSVRAKNEEMPTYQNIVNAFKDLTHKAAPGDLVYIHYSGHGDQVKTVFEEVKGKDQYDEGIVPMDFRENGYYLRDVEIAYLLNQMTRKGLIVTVIFDSCNSGGATRRDGRIRSSLDGKPDTNNRPLSDAVASKEELIETWQALTQGNSKTQGWPNPNGDYVFLGACLPSEFAWEDAFDDERQVSNGALTYFMLDTLRRAPVMNLTYQTLYERIKGQIISRYPTSSKKQTPMLLGESNRLIFGSEIKQVQYSLTVINVERETQQVRLDGGLGLKKGTVLSIYPLGNDFTDKEKSLAKVEITSLENSQVIAKILSMEESGVQPVIDKIEPGFSAVIESVPIDLKYRVRLFEKEVGDGENQLPLELVAQQKTALEKVRQAMQGNGWLIEVQTQQENADYQVAVGRQGNYEINRLVPIKNLNPALSIDDSNAPAEVVKRLIHLGKYQTALALDNPASELTRAIEYELLDKDKKPFSDQNNITVKSGDDLYLRLKNISSQPLNFVILDFEPAWEISQFQVQNQKEVFYSLSPNQELIRKFYFTVPSDEYYQDLEETLKLFVTRGVANFQYLILPSLDQPIQSRGNLNQEFQEKVDNIRSRGIAPSINPLNDLLATLGADINEPPQVSRKANPKINQNADWLTKQITVKIEQ